MKTNAGTRDDRRQDAWDRYARILRDQLAALDRSDPDLEWFHELAAQRSLLADEIDDLGRPLPETSESAELLGRIRERMEECRAVDRAVIDRLGELRRDTERALRQMEDRRAGRAGYVPAAPGSGYRVDVKS